MPGALPDWLFTLPRLFSLNLANNRLTDLPAPVDATTSLTILNLAGNPLHRVPEIAWRLTELFSLNLSRCPIVEIPADVLGLQRLEILTLGGHSSDGGRPLPDELRVPPPEVAARGLDAIKSYWRQEQEVGVDHLAEGQAHNRGRSRRRKDIDGAEDSRTRLCSPRYRDVHRRYRRAVLAVPRGDPHPPSQRRAHAPARHKYQHLGLRRPGDLPLDSPVLPHKALLVCSGDRRTQGRRRLRVLA